MPTYRRHPKKKSSLSFISALIVTSLTGLLCTVVPGAADAAIFSYISKSTGTPMDATYEWTITSWDYDDPTPNPCFQGNSCSVGVNHRHTAGTGGSYYDEPTWGYSTTFGGTPCVTESRTIGELGICLRDHPSDRGKSGVFLQLPMDGVTRHQGTMVSQECVGIFIQPQTSAGTSGGYLIPGSVCGIAPPPIGACSTPNDIMLDHGSLAQNAITGNTISSLFLIDCNQSVRGMLNMLVPADNYISLGNSGVKSSISINGTPALHDRGVPVNLVTGENRVTISSTLTSTGPVTAGSHQGDAIMVLSLQ